MGSRYHVKIGEQGFLLKLGSYRREVAAVAPSPGSRNLEPGWQWWHQSDWRGGDGQRNWGGTAGHQDGGARWRTGYGVEVAEAGRLKLGPSMEVSYSSPEDGFAAMLAFRGHLWALPTSSGKIYCHDGAAWYVAWDTGKGSMASLASYRGRLYAGSGSDGTVFVGDGSGWSTAFQVAGAASIACMIAYELWDPTARTTISHLFLGCRFSGGEARIYRWDGSSVTEIRGCEEANLEGMAVYRGRLYVATSDAGDGIQGRVLCFDGRSGSGEWSEVILLYDNYVAGWAIFDNLLFCGSGVGGRLWAFDGDRWVEAYSLSSASDPGDPGPLRALAVCAGRLYAGYSHPSEGMALLCKLPALEIEGRERGMTGREELQESRYGWYTPCTGGAGSTPQAMAVYGGQLYLAGELAGAAPIYRKDSASYRGNGLLETSLFDGGQPGVAKLLKSLTLTHDRLAAGQYLGVKFALEGSEGFQQIEGFEHLAGCDRVRTTADWRPDDGLVRLKGMPAQGFAGKRAGDLALPHTAWKLASPNPNSPPAAFAEEFTDAEYAAIAAEGGEPAMVTSTLEGGYALQLFQFDLSRLCPVELRPRALCYGRGDSSGVPAAGVIFRIWNHATSGWDMVGAHQAGPSDDPLARTIAGRSADFGRYLGPSGRVYLSLRSSHGGSASNPAEVGADLVELGALWAEEGEAVSQPLRLPTLEPVSEAAITLLSSRLPAGTQIELYLSADGGEHWEKADSGEAHSFVYPGVDLRWKARLSSADGSSTPEIHRLKLDYLTGRWLPLGRSDIEGSTSATFPFEKGTAARRVAFRIELGSADPLGSPALAGIALQYALQPETRRRWELELVCEGVPGAPLRLLDGSQEGKMGRELSQILWQARARGTAPFEDVDGGQYQVWFEGLEERLSDAPQERGLQTVVRCRLIEG